MIERALVKLAITNRAGDFLPPIPTYGEVVAPGLALVPDIGQDGEFTGLFCLAHIRSGHVIDLAPPHIAAGCAICVREIGRAARTCGIDWNAPAEEMTRKLGVMLRDPNGYPEMRRFVMMAQGAVMCPVRQLASTGSMGNRT